MINSLSDNHAYLQTLYTALAYNVLRGKVLKKKLKEVKSGEVTFVECAGCRITDRVVANR